MGNNWRSSSIIISIPLIKIKLERDIVKKVKCERSTSSRASTCSDVVVSSGICSAAGFASIPIYFSRLQMLRSCYSKREKCPTSDRELEILDICYQKFPKVRKVITKSNFLDFMLQKYPHFLLIKVLTKVNF